ncbi:MAG: YHS domain protein [Defluviimonas sp.]|nr:YHS domain protein [Paracoccaceae bacterium]MCC0063817.1 YHS domain protein [Defluviimonas sp.]
MTITRRLFLGTALLLPVAGTILRPALADEPEIFGAGGVAISGYDPVSYFTKGKAEQGRPDFALMWRGATWYFSTEESREAFEMNPSAYAPQYGGYCAYAMAKGAIASSMPDAFTIHEGKLYLNNSLEVRSIWQQDIDRNIRSADTHWPSALHQ